MIHNIKELNLDIRVHLCLSCTHQFDACQDIQFLYGTGDGNNLDFPNICACNGFDPSLISRPEGKKDRKAETIPRFSIPEEKKDLENLEKA